LHSSDKRPLGSHGLARSFELFNEIGIVAQLARTQLTDKMPVGLMSSHFGILNHLIRVADGPTPMALANAFQIPKTTMTHTLKGLKTHRLISIKPCQDDGRSKRVWITDSGQRLRDQTIASLGPELASLLHLIPEQQLKTMIEALTTIRKQLDSNRSR
jgi:DNA-binding MarR family transcriptional regulator